MVKRSAAILLVIAVVIAGAIGGTIVFLSQQNVADAATQTTPSAISLNDGQDSAITDIELQKDDVTIALELGDDGIWQIAGHSSGIDQAVAENISSYLAETEALQVIDIADPSLSAYGLDSGNLVVTYSTARGTYTYYYGQYTSDKSAVFFRRDGDGNVYTIDASSFNGIVGSFSMLENELVNIPSTTETASIVFQAADGPEVVLEQSGDNEWTMTSPISRPLSDDAQALLEACFNAESGFAGDEVLSEYGIDSGTWLEFRDSAGDTLMYIALGVQSGDEVYCSIDEKTGAFLLSEAVAELAEAAPFSLIDQRFLSIDDFSLLEQLTVTKDDETVVLAKTEDGYTVNDESVTDEEAENLFDGCAAITCVGEVADKVGSVLYCSVVATSSDGGQISIDVYPYLNDYYAIDYGSGAQLYVDAAALDSFLTAFFE